MHSLFVLFCVYNLKVPPCNKDPDRLMFCYLFCVSIDALNNVNKNTTVKLYHSVKPAAHVTAGLNGTLHGHLI